MEIHKGKLTINNVVQSTSNLKIFSTFAISSTSLFVVLLLFPMEVPVPLSFFFTLIFVFPIGYASLIPVRKLDHIPLGVRLSLYFGTGYVLSFIWSYFISPFTVHPIAFFVLFIISIVIALHNLYKKSQSSETEDKDHWLKIDDQQVKDQSSFRLTQPTVKSILKSNEIIIFGIIIIAAIYTATSISGWPPFGDINRDHAPHTVLQIFQGNFVSHVPLFPEKQVSYPLGIHLFAANLSILYNISPAQIFLLLGGIGIFLIFTTVLSITHMLTKSAWLSIIVVAAMLHVHHSRGILTELLGYLNGTIPNLTGVFLLFLLILFLIITRNNIRPTNLVFIALLVLGGLMAYLPTLSYSILIVTSFVVTNYHIKKLKKKTLKSNYFFKVKIKKLTKSIHFYLLTIIILGTSTGVFFENIENFLEISIGKKILTDLDPESRYVHVPDIFEDDFFIASVIVGIICSIFVILYSKKERFLAYFVLVFILLTISGDYLIGPSKIIFSPGRFIQLVPVLSWILLGLVVNTFCKKSYRMHKTFPNSGVSNQNTESNVKNTLGDKKKSLVNNPKHLLKKYSVIFIFAVITISLIPNISGTNYAPSSNRAIQNHFMDFSLYSFGDPTKKYGYMESYMEGINWIVKNVPPDALILDFWWKEGVYTHPHQFEIPYKWIQSIGHQNLVNNQFRGPYYGFTSPLALELNKAFENYKNTVNLFVNLEENDVKYILTQPNEKRNKVLNNSPFFILVYEDDYTSIYAVKQFHDANEKALTQFEVRISDILNYLKEFELASKDRPAYEDLGIFYELNQIELQATEWKTYLDIATYDNLTKAHENKNRMDSILEDNKKLRIYADEFVEQKLDIAIKSRHMGEFDTALEIYDEILNKINPADHKVWIGKFKTLIESGQEDEAFSTYLEMKRVHGMIEELDRWDRQFFATDFAAKRDSILEMAIIMESVSEYREAMHMYDYLLDDDRFDVEILKNKAGALRELEEYSLLMNTYELILKLEPDNEEIKSRLLEITKKTGR